MIIETIKTGLLKVNTYIVFNESIGQCIVIDAGDDYKNIVEIIKKHNSTCKAILLTHGHFDHIGAVKDFQDSGVPVYLHKDDENYALNPKSIGFPQLAKSVKPFSADIFVKDEEILKIAGFEIQVIHTPGHSKGSVTYKIENNLFAGDTLFFHSIGRTDFIDGNFDDIIKSIKEKLFCFSNMNVYCGHNQFTTIDEEKKNNPYLN